MTESVPQLLAGVRVIESSLLGPGLLTTFLAEVLGYNESRIGQLENLGVLGK